MHDMSDWQSKDDLDLTSEDISTMFAAGVPVEVQGPVEMPSAAVLLKSVQTYGGSTKTLSRPTGSIKNEMRVTKQLV